MEIIKSYSVPVITPKDLIEEYFKLRKIALDVIFKHVKFSRSGKAHLKFSKNDRKKLRDELLRNWKFAKHYVDSAINSIIGLVKGWIQLYNKGKAKSKPKITKKTVYVKTTLFSVRNGKIKITIEPRKRYLEIDLAKFDYLPKDYDSIGGLILQEDKLIITFKKKVKPIKPKDYASFDVNLTNITGFINGRIVRFDLRELYHIHRVYEEKRKRIQKLSRTKPKTAKKLMQKYSKRERNRAMDLMHKVTTTIARELISVKHGAILEDLRNVKDRILNSSKDLNRKLSKWNCRMFQSMLEYKLKWFGLPVKYVDPANSSKTCPVCSGSLVAYRDRLMKCENCGLIADRDVVAVLNLRMWGFGVTPNGDELPKVLSFGSDVSQSGHMSIKDYVR